MLAIRQQKTTLEPLLEENPRKELEDYKVVLEVALWVILYLGDTGYIDRTSLGILSIYTSFAKWRVQEKSNMKEGVSTTAKRVEKLMPSMEFLGGSLLAVLLMTDQITPDLYLWTFFGVQLTCMSACQIAKRLSDKERYFGNQDNTKKYLEDSKFFLENIAFWTVMLLGEMGIIDTYALGFGAIGILSVRTIMEYKLSKMDQSSARDTAAKITKLLPYVELAVCMTLSLLTMGAVMTPDNDLWYFFGTQLFLMITQQLSKKSLEIPTIQVTQEAIP